MGDARIELVPYDPSWPERFRSEAAELTRVLAPWLAAAPEHVGSTAIPGLSAKPVIDIVAPVRELGSARAAIPLLERELGYLHWAEDPNRDYRCWFLKPRPELRTHHLVLIEASHPELRALVGFRDHLRAHPEVAAEYERLKRALAAAHAEDRNAYSDAKAGFVRGVLAQLGLESARRPVKG
jgi:GrpB-like predicted nucleotidyltransferase (UPF0157 family)